MNTCNNNQTVLQVIASRRPLASPHNGIPRRTVGLCNARFSLEYPVLKLRSCPIDGRSYRQATSTKPYEFIRFGEGCRSTRSPVDKAPSYRQTAVLFDPKAQTPIFDGAGTHGSDEASQRDQTVKKYLAFGHENKNEKIRRNKQYIYIYIFIYLY